MNEIKVGCCGFPIKKEVYFKTFNLVELQNTFYDPDIDSLKKLKENAKNINKKFEFIIKAFQVITHEATSPTYRKMKKEFGKKENFGYFKNTEEVFLAWDLMRNIADLLEAKVILFQTPPSFKEKNENIENIRNFFSSIKRDSLILVWEPRGDWHEETLYRISNELNLVICNDPFKGKTFGEINYFRLHGKPNYNLRYSYTINDLEYIKKACNKKLNYVLFNNFDMFKNAKELISILKSDQETQTL